MLEDSIIPVKTELLTVKKIKISIIDDITFQLNFILNKYLKKNKVIYLLFLKYLYLKINYYEYRKIKRKNT